MNKNNILYILPLTLAACGPQAPAPVVGGYNGNKPVQIAQEYQNPRPMGVASGRASMAEIEPAAGPRSSSVRTPQNAAAVEMVEHTVLPTDTVYGLARQYETSTQSILQNNGLHSTSDIRAGQTLTIPAHSKPQASVWQSLTSLVNGNNGAAMNGTTSAAATRRTVAPVTVATSSEPPRLLPPREPQEVASVVKTEEIQPASAQRYSLSRKQMEPMEGEKVAGMSSMRPLASIEPAAGVPPQQNVPEADHMAYLTHQVLPGETIYRISRQYNAAVLDIMAANAFEKPQDLKAGTMVKIPVDNQATAAHQAEKQGVLADKAPAEKQAEKQVISREDLTSATQTVATRQVEGEKVETIGGPGSEDVKAEEDVGPVKAVQPPQPMSAADEIKAEMKRGQVDPAAAHAEGRVWPVRGKIVRHFGEQGNGVANTGINIQVPAGTPVLATDEGRVLYAGNGLKTYGNLVLLRHSNGMVSAYAHNGHLLVRKDEKVKKGQIIAMSGSSGNVDQPQLHFELRQHASAVDPLKVLPKL